VTDMRARVPESDAGSWTSPRKTRRARSCSGTSSDTSVRARNMWLRDLGAKIRLCRVGNVRDARYHQSALASVCASFWRRGLGARSSNSVCPRT
jgi:hypothetical protein